MKNEWIKWKLRTPGINQQSLGSAVEIAKQVRTRLCANYYLGKSIKKIMKNKNKNIDRLCREIEDYEPDEFGCREYKTYTKKNKY